MKAIEIKHEFLSKQEFKKQLDRDKEEALQRHNRWYAILGKNGERMAQTYMKKLTDNLVANLGDDVKETIRGVGDSLVEIPLRGGKYRQITIHNRYYLSNPEGGITYKIRNDDLETREGQITDEPNKEAVRIYDEYVNFIVR